MTKENPSIAIIGLGYVGLPLAVAFSEKYQVVGLDINNNRVDELREGHDSTLEVSKDELRKVLLDKISDKKGLYVTFDKCDISHCSVFIITVPTPTDKHNRPVLMPMIRASETVASFLKKGDIVIYESTVYPGVTEDEMVPVLEKNSGLIFNRDFFCGYSPERINPGDKEHTVTKILKITSGSTAEIADYIDELYGSIITAGTHKAPSIKVAEAAKVIENSQRDINIAFINELSKIFTLLGIDTDEVLKAASTKWNFLNFKPGLVGGHCIGVDPYYLAQKAQEVGYNPEIILAGRRLNDSMGRYIANEVIRLMILKSINIIDSKILLLGFTFKENCPDIRNTRVIDIYHEFKKYNLEIDIYDPWANQDEVFHEYGIHTLGNDIDLGFSKYSSIVVSVAHDVFQSLNIKKTAHQVIFDVKGILGKENSDGRL
jgi:UDP-N-acetyl-D-galactosamine dehydrogenase